MSFATHSMAALPTLTLVRLDFGRDLVRGYSYITAKCIQTHPKLFAWDLEWEYSDVGCYAITHSTCCLPCLEHAVDNQA